MHFRPHLVHKFTRGGLISALLILASCGSSNSQNATSGSTVTFTHTYATANSYTWSATASDSVNANSENLSKTVSVSKNNVAPTLNFISGNTTATTGTVYTVQLQGNDIDNNLSSLAAAASLFVSIKPPFVSAVCSSSG